jgi:hypothetical protein
VSEPTSTLRGARVDVDIRRLRRPVAVIVMAALAVATVAAFVSGANKNDHIAALHAHGVRLEMTVTSCLGNLGGSGSNAAGDSCRGGFTLDGHRYVEDIPGNVTRQPGDHLTIVTVPGEPGVLALPASLPHEQTSWRVFILPVVLLVLLVAGCAGIAVRWRQRRERVPRGV